MATLNSLLWLALWLCLGGLVASGMQIGVEREGRKKIDVRV